MKNENESVTPITPLETITADTLMKMEFEPLSYAVDELLPQGIFILAGSGKIGKSWLALDMCIAVATGGKLWDYKATSGEVLYMALEDNFRRLQSRMLEIIEETGGDYSRLHFAIASLGISNGLIEQVNTFIKANPTTRLIVIDTLEHIRNTVSETSIYSHDYNDITALKPITEKNNVTVLLVHHTRKMYDPDPLNMLTGSTGLVGAVDGVWVLEKEARTALNGKLTIANRDTKGYCFKVQFDEDNFKWSCLGLFEKTKKEDEVEFCDVINAFLEQNWRGTATELATAITEIKVTATTITRKLNKYQTSLKEDYGIIYNYDRSKSGRVITLSRADGDR